MFDQSFLIGGASGGPSYSTLTVVLYLYNQAIGNIKFGYAAAVGVVLFAFIFTVTLIQRLLFGRADVAWQTSIVQTAADFHSDNRLDILWQDVGGTPAFEGGRRTARVSLTKGRYRFLCTVGDHAKLGMVGTIDVR